MKLRNDSDLKFAAALLLIGVVFQSIFISYNSSTMGDEGLNINSALRIISGEIPYRDFFSMYAPGNLYYLALVQLPFNSSAYASRSAAVLQLGLACFVSYYLSRRITGSRLIAAVPSLMLAFAGSEGTRVLFALLALYVSTLYFEKKDLRLLAAAGFLAGLAIVFSQEVGAYAIGAMLIAIAAQAVLSRDARKAVREFLFIGIPAILPILLVAALFLLSSALPGLIYDLFTFPVVQFQSKMSLPYPNPLALIPGADSLSAAAGLVPGLLSGSPAAKEALRPFYNFAVSFAFYYPLLVFAVLLAAILRSAFLKRKWTPREASIALFVAFGILSLKSVATRADFSHLAATIPAFAIPGAAAIELSAGWAGKQRGAARAASAILLALLLAFPAFFIAHSIAYKGYSLISSRGALEISGETVRVPEPLARDTNGLTAYLRSSMGPQDELVALPFDSMLYVMLGKKNPTRYDYVLRDVTGEQQREIIGGLQTRQVRFVAYDSVEIDGFTMQEYAPELYRYISANYRNESQFGTYTVFERQRD